jgi:putative (di)nucleoside polyphosphate hydrolase
VTHKARSPEPGYRPCVGLAVFNADGLVFIGRRRFPAETDLDRGWQMPQGGIDPDETPHEAALRELYEETNIRSVSQLGEIDDWLCYDIPAAVSGRPWKGRYRGQAQKWLAFRFTGDDAEIDVERPADGRHKAEFSEWRWEELTRVPELIVDFKRPVYEEVVRAFAPYAKPARRASKARS